MKGGGGVIINLAKAGGNTQREWGKEWKITNRLCMHLPLRSSSKKVSAPLTPEH